MKSLAARRISHGRCCSIWIWPSPGSMPSRAPRIAMARAGRPPGRKKGMQNSWAISRWGPPKSYLNYLIYDIISTIFVYACLYRINLDRRSLFINDFHRFLDFDLFEALVWSGGSRPLWPSCWSASVSSCAQEIWMWRPGNSTKLDETWRNSGTWWEY